MWTNSILSFKEWSKNVLNLISIKQETLLAEPERIGHIIADFLNIPINGEELEKVLFKNATNNIWEAKNKLEHKGIGRDIKVSDKTKTLLKEFGYE